MPKFGKLEVGAYTVKGKYKIFKHGKSLIVDHWDAPEEDGVPVITMPNIPHSIMGDQTQPRTIFGTGIWNKMRRRCYEEANDTCAVCGDCPEDKHKRHCLERGTEVLTKAGWKAVETVTTEDIVAQFDPDTKKISWAHPTDTVHKYQDEIVHIGLKNHRFEMGYSKDHEVLVYHTKNIGNDGYEKITEPMTFPAESVPLSWSNKIPTAGYGTGDNVLTTEERLYIAANADGSVDRKRQTDQFYCRIRISKPKKVERLKMLLAETSLRWNEVHDNRENYYGVAIWFDRDPKDFWQSFSVDMGVNKAKAFIDELVKWDGWEGQRKNGKGKSFPGRCWYTTKQDQADFVQAVASQAGLTTTVSVTNRAVRIWPEACGNRNKGTSACLPQINIEFLSREERGTASMKRSVDRYNDDVFCISVPSHYFVARTKDKYVFVTHNCHELFSYDYKNRRAYFERCVCLCATCHVGFIHSGRALAKHMENPALFTKEGILNAVEHGFKQVAEYNQYHPSSPLRVYDTILSYCDVPELEEEMLALIKKYKIKFYGVEDEVVKDWGNWRVVINGQEYAPPYSDKKGWREAIAKINKEDKAKENPFKGGGFDLIEQLLKEANEIKE